MWGACIWGPPTKENPPQAPPPPPTPPPKGAFSQQFHASHQTFFRYLFLTVTIASSGLTSFHGVTGGVYKAWERIHCRMAGQRLLVIPISRTRVAIYNPN